MTSIQTITEMLKVMSAVHSVYTNSSLDHNKLVRAIVADYCTFCTVNPRPPVAEGEFTPPSSVLITEGLPPGSTGMHVLTVLIVFGFAPQIGEEPAAALRRVSQTLFTTYCTPFLLTDKSSLEAAFNTASETLSQGFFAPIWLEATKLSSNPLGTLPRLLAPLPTAHVLVNVKMIYEYLDPKARDELQSQLSSLFSNTSDPEVNTAWQRTTAWYDELSTAHATKVEAACRAAAAAAAGTRVTSAGDPPLPACILAFGEHALIKAVTSQDALTPPLILPAMTPKSSSVAQTANTVPPAEDKSRGRKTQLRFKDSANKKAATITSDDRAKFAQRVQAGKSVAVSELMLMFLSAQSSCATHELGK